MTNAQKPHLARHAGALLASACMLVATQALAAPFAYVANVRDAFVTVIDTATQTRVTDIALARPAFGVVVSPDGRYAYLTPYFGSGDSSSQLTVVDTATQTIVNTIPIPGSHWRINLTPGGNQLYVTNYYEGTVSVFDTATWQLVTTLTAPYPAHVGFTPDGASAYIVSHCSFADPPGGGCTNSSSVIVVDTQTFAVRGTVPTGGQAYSIAFTRNGRFAYVANSYSFNVAVIDTGSLTVAANITGFQAPYDIAISPDGKWAYVANNVQDNVSGFVSIVDTVTQQVVNTVSVPAPFGVAFTPDGRFAYVSQGTYFVNEGIVRVIDTATQTVVGSPIPTGRTPWTVAIQPPPRSTLSFIGFQQPVGGADETGGSFAAPLRTFKLGSTIPIKFVLYSGTTPVVAGAHTLQMIKYTSATTFGDPIDATPQDAATTGSEFRLAAEGTWHFNASTTFAGASVGIWKIVATLSDGSQHVAWVQLK